MLFSSNMPLRNISTSFTSDLCKCLDMDQQASNTSLPVSTPFIAAFSYPLET